ncbi:MAG: heavy-metal-associated domain-containing protein [Flavisolibacter sp.]
MKTLQLLIISCLFISSSAFAQTKTEKIKVSGECGMCKTKIEKAAKTGGANYAVWDVDTKELTVKYSSSSSNSAKIQKAIAETGYDTEKVKATQEAYDKLHSCCKYDRTASVDATSCCDHEKCATEKCSKDGKCEKDMTCCKDAGCDQKECCKKS